MRFIWDETKNQKLLAERGVSFDVFADLIAAGKIYDMTKNPVRENQKIFVVPFKDYTYVVPFVRDTEGNFVLKTIYPNRKLHKKYGGHHDAE